MAVDRLGVTRSQVKRATAQIVGKGAKITCKSKD